MNSLHTYEIERAIREERLAHFIAEADADRMAAELRAAGRLEPASGFRPMLGRSIVRIGVRIAAEDARTEGRLAPDASSERLRPADHR